MRLTLKGRAEAVASAPWAYASEDISALIRELMFSLPRSENEDSPDEVEGVPI